ncbi:MAG TPA: hypothetical protein VL492_02505, partial [Methylovirgula sp.]|nr:hypothetical protein [Methylovirgula sp.]
MGRLSGRREAIVPRIFLISFSGLRDYSGLSINRVLIFAWCTKKVEDILEQDQFPRARSSNMSGADPHIVHPFEHPGEGKKRAKSTPKGRQVDLEAAEE